MAVPEFTRGTRHHSWFSHRGRKLLCRQVPARALLNAKLALCSLLGANRNKMVPGGVTGLLHERGACGERGAVENEVL